MWTRKGWRCTGPASGGGHGDVSLMGSSTPRRQGACFLQHCNPNLVRPPCKGRECDPERRERTCSRKVRSLSVVPQVEGQCWLADGEEREHDFRDRARLLLQTCPFSRL